VAIRMQEHLSRDAKNALATPLMNHIATPSSFPHPGDEPWLDVVRTLGSTEFERRLKKLEQFVEVVAAMNWKI
jgi:hypothetical protein